MHTRCIRFGMIFLCANDPYKDEIDLNNPLKVPHEYIGSCVMGNSNQGQDEVGA